MTYVRPTVRQQREEQARTQTALVEAESWRTELNSLASRLGFVLDELGAPTMQGNGQFGLSLEGRIRQLAAPTNPEATLRMLEAVVGPEKDDSILCYRKSVELEIAREADGSLSYLEIGYTCGEPDNKVRSRAEALALLCEHAEQAGISISRPLTEGGIADVVAWSEEHPPKEKGAK